MTRKTKSQRIKERNWTIYKAMRNVENGNRDSEFQKLADKFDITKVHAYRIYSKMNVHVKGESK